MVELDRQFGSVSLTDRERDILRLLTNGLTDSEIAEAAILTVGTVKWYNRQIYNKLGVRNRTEAVAQAQRLGLLRSASRPASSSPPTPKHNLPAHVSSFIGRSRELAELKTTLLAARLVTLTGAPGTGKTRLALEVASVLLEHYPDGVYFVSLASIRDVYLVAHTIAQALHVKETGSQSIFAALKATLQDKHILLVLDNFEHLLPAAPLVSDLLASAPSVSVLVTSRESLRLYGEHEFPVPPLQVPDLHQSLTADALKPYEAVELFMQRAQACAPTFDLDDSNANAIANICAHLDGLPLAIELAAARVKFYAPQTLLLRLSSRLEALGEGPRDMPLRQRTMRAALAWSYDLLDPEEQVVFARLGVFAGGWTLENAETICGDGLNLSIPSSLESLLNKNLLQREQSTDNEPRFMMLETMREYALEKLAEWGETGVMGEQHAQYFAEMVAHVAQEYSGSKEAFWLNWLEQQHDNLLTALHWFLVTPNMSQRYLDLIGNLARFWELHGYFSEARVWLAQALALPGADARTKARANACYGIGLLTLRQGDHAAAQALCEDALTIYQDLGDQRSVAFTLVRLSEIASVMGDYAAATALSQQAYTITQQLDDGGAHANALCQLGFDAMRFGKYEQARTYLEEGLEISRTIHDSAGIAAAYSGLGELGVRLGELDLATTWLEESVRLRQELSDTWGIAVSLGSLAWVALRRNDLERATDILKESLLLRHKIGEQGGMAWCWEKLAEIALANHDAGGAVRIFGAAATIRRSIGSTIDPVDQPHYQDMVEHLRNELGRDVFEAVWFEGQSMNLEQILQYTFPDTSP